VKAPASNLPTLIEVGPNLTYYLHPSSLSVTIIASYDKP